MIAQTTISDVTCIGNIQRNSIKIDAKDYSHILTILSSNLYSNPIQSFLRETVSNAADSQKEAGVKEPILIYIAKDKTTIRDYGTGISPERFQEVYLSLGSSTKRESNDYIGAFGIGRFSALSVCDSVLIRSYYEGKLYTYVMTKSNASISIDLMSTTDTTEPNGVAITVTVPSVDVVSNLEYLQFFPVYVKSEENYFAERQFNDRKIQTFNTFAIVSKQPYNHHILVGAVPYPIDRDFIEDIPWRITSIVPKFKIGELDIAPTRENLLYSAKTKAVIEKRYKEVWEEIVGMVKEEYHMDCTTLKEYSKLQNNTYVTKLQITIPKSPQTILGIPATYKGRDISHLLYKITNGIQAIADTKCGYFRSGKYANMLYDPICIVKGTSLSAAQKQYISKYHTEPLYIVSRDSIKDWVRERFRFTTNEDDKILLKSLLRDLYRQADITYLDWNSSEYKAFLQERRKSIKASKSVGLDALVNYSYRLSHNSSSHKGTATSMYKLVQRYKNEHVVFGSYNEDRAKYIRYLTRDDSLCYIGLPKGILQQFIQDIPTNWEPIDALFSNKKAIRIKSLIEALSKYPNLVKELSHYKLADDSVKWVTPIGIAHNLCSYLPMDIKGSICRVMDVCEDYSGICEHIKAPYKDTQIMDDVRKLNQLLEIEQNPIFQTLYASNCRNITPLFAYQCMKKKLFRVDYNSRYIKPLLTNNYK